ncbi:hypothetical protein CTA1_12875 [Colletotrichum tanaceti]|uniref:Uncharacterized protein n=1 Tax=Colletotrichum tanaceti TaxID=1306861 RepID=A0A4U6XG07_9PEZI|nr:hypothetical protein CTA1_12875 [Colletotrichum tanaceti]
MANAVKEELLDTTAMITINNRVEPRSLAPNALALAKLFFVSFIDNAYKNLKEIVTNAGIFLMARQPNEIQAIQLNIARVNFLRRNYELVAEMSTNPATKEFITTMYNALGHTTDETADHAEKDEEDEPPKKKINTGVKGDPSGLIHKDYKPSTRAKWRYPPITDYEPKKAQITASTMAISRVIVVTAGVPSASLVPWKCKSK